LHRPRELSIPGEEAHEGGSNPVLSIIVLTLNSSRFIEQCLGSLEPLPERIEVLVVDGGSVDSTLELISQRFPFAKIIAAPGTTIPEARNLGLLKAEGDYVYYLDSDDLVYHDALEELTAVLATSHPDLVVCGMDFADSEGKILMPRARPHRSGPLIDLLRYPGGAIVYSRPILVRAGGYRQTLALAEDRDVWLRVTEKVQPSFFRTLEMHRIHNNSITAQKPLQTIAYSLMASLIGARRRGVLVTFGPIILFRYLTWLLNLDRLPLVPKRPKMFPRILAKIFPEFATY